MLILSPVKYTEFNLLLLCFLFQLKLLSMFLNFAISIVLGYILKLELSRPGVSSEYPQSM